MKFGRLYQFFLVISFLFIFASLNAATSNKPFPIRYRGIWYDARKLLKRLPNSEKCAHPGGCETLRP